MSLHPVHNLVDFFSRPLIGVTTSLGSVIASLLPHLETGMRLGVLFLGLIAGVLTVRKSWKDRHK
jgi:F0F1-type ATP synthase assembly protein I